MFSLREWPSSKCNKNEHAAHRQTSSFVELLSKVENCNNVSNTFKLLNSFISNSYCKFKLAPSKIIINYN